MLIMLNTASSLRQAYTLLTDLMDVFDTDSVPPKNDYGTDTDNVLSLKVISSDDRKVETKSTDGIQKACLSSFDNASTCSTSDYFYSLSRWNPEKRSGFDWRDKEHMVGMVKKLFGNIESLIEYRAIGASAAFNKVKNDEDDEAAGLFLLNIFLADPKHFRIPNHQRQVCGPLMRDVNCLCDWAVAERATGNADVPKKILEALAHVGNYVEFVHRHISSSSYSIKLKALVPDDLLSEQSLNQNDGQCLDQNYPSHSLAHDNQSYYTKTTKIHWKLYGGCDGTLLRAGYRYIVHKFKCYVRDHCVRCH